MKKKIKAVHAKREETKENENVHKGLQGQVFTRRLLRVGQILTRCTQGIARTGFYKEGRTLFNKMYTRCVTRTEFYKEGRTLFNKMYTRCVTRTGFYQE